jgi:hypothetical protein
MGNSCGLREFERLLLTQQERLTCNLSLFSHSGKQSTIAEEFKTRNGFLIGESECIQNGVYVAAFIETHMNTFENLIPVSWSH